MQSFSEFSGIDEAHKIGDKVEIVKGSSKGITGHIGEIRHGLFKGAPKTYTVYHGEHGAVQVKKEHIRAVKKTTNEEVELDEEIKVGHKVHVGHMVKGGAGVIGHVTKIEDDKVYIKNDEGRTFRGQLKNASKISEELEEAKDPADLKDYADKEHNGHYWRPTGKVATHNATKRTTYEYERIDHEGNKTGDRHYKDARGKYMGEERVCPVCGQTPCNCTHIEEGYYGGKQRSAAWHADGGANDEGWGSSRMREVHKVHINGRHWKTFGSASEAQRAGDAVKKKYPEKSVSVHRSYTEEVEQLAEISADKAEKYYDANHAEKRKNASDLGLSKDEMRKAHNRVVGANRALDRMYGRQKLKGYKEETDMSLNFKQFTERLHEAGAYQKDMDEKKPVFAQGVKGMKSKPFVKKFKSMDHYNKWADSEASGDHEVHRVYQEDVEFEYQDLTLVEDFDALMAEAKSKCYEDGDEEGEEKVETRADKKADKLGRKRSQPLEFHDGEDDGKGRITQEELKGKQHKLDKNKNGKLDAHDFELLRKEESELTEGAEKHRVQVTISDPNHDAVTKRKEQIQKHIRISGEHSKEEAVKRATAHYKKQGYKVHSAEHVGMVKEEVQLNERINADDYHATSEPSQFGGHRPKVVHKTKGTTMYLGQAGYKTKSAAAEGAKAYLDAYERIGDHAASRAAWNHAKNHPDTIREQNELDEGEVVKTATGIRHKGTYGSEYETDREGNEKKKVAAPAEKRGRGRPKKGSDESGNVKKYTFHDLLNRLSRPTK